jgi:hypothetical protein
MPALNLLLQHFVDHLMLLNYGQALEFRGFDFDCVHGSAATADVLDLHVDVSNRIPYLRTFGCFDMLTLLTRPLSIFGTCRADALWPSPQCLYDVHVRDAAIGCATGVIDAECSYLRACAISEDEKAGDCCIPPV